MKITNVKVETIRIPMKKPFRIAFAVQDHSLNVLVLRYTLDNQELASLSLSRTSQALGSKLL